MWSIPIFKLIKRKLLIDYDNWLLINEKYHNLKTEELIDLYLKLNKKVSK